MLGEPDISSEFSRPSMSPIFPPEGKRNVNRFALEASIDMSKSCLCQTRTFISGVMEKSSPFANTPASVSDIIDINPLFSGDVTIKIVRDDVPVIMLGAINR